MAHAVTLIPGDWIGPELSEVVRAVVAAAGADVAWETFDEVADADGALSAALLESARRTGFVLTNRVAADRIKGSLPPSVALRKALGCHVQVRYAHNLPGVPARFDDVDIAVVRELTEGVYTGLEHETAPGVYEQVKVTTVEACERVARFAFEGARRWGREKVTIVHKSNIMKQSDGMFLRTAQRVAADYSDVACDEVIVDALCMKLVVAPSRFDVLLCGNLFGDIVADLAAGLGGGICADSGTSFADGVTIFENPHGKAPSLVGTGRANPVPPLIAAINLLHDLGERDAAQRISQATKDTLSAGVRTPDLGGAATTAEVRDGILRSL